MWLQEDVEEDTNDEFQRSPNDELQALAANLGETCMAQDLTALLSYLQEDMTKVRKKRNRISVALKVSRAWYISLPWSDDAHADHIHVW